MIRKAVDPREDAAGFVLVIVAGHRRFDDSGKYNGKAKSHDPIEVAHEELLESRWGALQTHLQRTVCTSISREDACSFRCIQH